MPDMKTLTVGGVTYTIVDSVAREGLDNVYSKTEIDAILGSYIEDVNALLGGDE